MCSLPSETSAQPGVQIRRYARLREEEWTQEVGSADRDARRIAIRGSASACNRRTRCHRHNRTFRPVAGRLRKVGRFVRRREVVAVCLRYGLRLARRRCVSLCGRSQSVSGLWRRKGGWPAAAGARMLVSRGSGLAGTAGSFAAPVTTAWWSWSSMPGSGAACRCRHGGLAAGGLCGRPRCMASGASPEQVICSSKNLFAHPREAGDPVTSQVTTGSGSIRRSQIQPDNAGRLTCRYPTQRDAAGRNRQEWHARGLGFESP
jgi:hypothetical protein